ncbi:hypothetical protein SAMN02982985_03183 [Rugamonas rubra]|uniref:Uncharacterized protein n=1 Tax=Rugamonas rubra TaxID=758825 RepID=A0A1I4NWR7_9BURK|nr:hypothetical protein SAMN02982985_03183 [Rugamonas rubra]
MKLRACEQNTRDSRISHIIIAMLGATMHNPAQMTHKACAANQLTRAFG